MRAVQFARVGGPEVLTPVEVAEPAIEDNGLLVDVCLAGVNFLDVYYRRGTYQAPLPLIPGDEGVGIVREVGRAVAGISAGDRVAWVGAKAGYAEMVMVPAARAVRLPANVPDEAGLLLANGLTAHYLAHDIAPITPETVALVHAAAGGVGSMLTRILKMRGARVIATTSSDRKIEVVRSAGADQIIVLGAPDFAPRVRELTANLGVDLVFDGVGRSTFDASLASLRVRGTLVLFGASSGPVDPIDPMRLARAGSIAFIRPSLFHFIATPEVLQARADELFGWLANGKLELRIGGRFPLERAADAHRAIEARTSTGKLILTTQSPS